MRHAGAARRLEFAAKLGICVEEADECEYWLELIGDGKLIPEAKAVGTSSGGA